MSSLIATARAFALSGLRRTNRFAHRPTGYMANGSFHDELLSVHKTQTVSLTHRINAKLPRGFRDTFLLSDSFRGQCNVEGHGRMEVVATQLPDSL